MLSNPNPIMVVSTSKTLAVIDENNCIGCTLCIKACPFDAIIGTSKQLHSVISAYCTGCKLCIPSCPVDCISMRNNEALQNSPLTALQLRQAKIEFARASKRRVAKRKERLSAQQMQQDISLADKKEYLAEKLQTLKKST